MVVVFPVIGTRVREKEIRSLHDVCVCMCVLWISFFISLSTQSIINQRNNNIERNRRMEGMEWKEGMM